MRFVALWAVAIVPLPSCGLEGLGNALTHPCGTNGCTSGPQDCASLYASAWEVGPFPTPLGDAFRLAVGESRTVFLFPPVESACAAAIASVTWSTEDGLVASVTPKPPGYQESWVTGVKPGPTTVGARIVLGDGRARLAKPRAIQVIPVALPAGSVLVTEGAVDLEPYKANSSTDFRRFIPFMLPQEASQVDLSVDWTSFLDKVDLVLFQGTCSGGPASACPDLRLVASPRVTDAKPLPISASNLSPGPYTLRIDNLGPGPETIRYEVRLTPK
jgi:hypothetical protein